MNGIQKIISLLIGVALVCSGLWVLQQHTNDTTPITIGFIGPFSMERGAWTQAAVKLAVEKVNIAGGINGRKLEVIYKDGQCDRIAAAEVAHELIHTHDVPVILGGACSHETLAFTEMAEQSNTVVLSYCSAASEISDAGDYIFRNVPSGIHLARFAAKYLRKVAKKERIAILYTDVPYGITIADELAKNFIKNGGEVVVQEPHEYTNNAVNLENQIAKIQETQPDLIYFLGYANQLAPGVRQIRKAGIDIPIFGGGEWDNSEVWQEPAVNGVEYLVARAKDTNEFKNTMKNRFNVNEITGCIPQAYDGLRMLAQVIEKVGEDAESIKNELYRTVYESDISSNKTAFDENGDILSTTYVVNRIEDGVPVKVEYYRVDQHGEYIQVARSR